MVAEWHSLCEDHDAGSSAWPNRVSTLRWDSRWLQYGAHVAGSSAAAHLEQRVVSSDAGGYPTWGRSAAQIMSPMEGPRHKNVTFAGGFNVWQDYARVRSRVRIATPLPLTVHTRQKRRTIMRPLRMPEHT